MPTWIYWRIYKVFHDPPGTPDALRCVNCKYISAAGLFGLSAVTAYGVKKTIGPRVYLGCTLAGGVVLSLASGFIALRMAKEDQKWNDIQIRVKTEELARLRKQTNTTMELNNSGGQIQPA